MYQKMQQVSTQAQRKKVLLVGTDEKGNLEFGQVFPRDPSVWPISCIEEIAKGISAESSMTLISRGYFLSRKPHPFVARVRRLTWHSTFSGNEMVAHTFITVIGGVILCHDVMLSPLYH
ncbi:uncharacterized protein BT62DRAFT_149749 [Guyanagaster necrorhizus]|uniref:Uncharacterized protein n=1 Tax=Guyanagaster necrorhizus TaxID=856835 RepID=A0A9P7VT17_9AGAR|nr:uncharacterized protein BT62DRAFT_149749 [Guyanagaster necrorhizus MCA 3950]KAG7446037.1 hypothetical protein BT62DRAFT_149749 [Guyanagaster necrorhizus MCA 3950]